MNDPIPDNSRPLPRRASSCEMIARAARASRLMTVPERAEIMVRAGLLTRDRPAAISRPEEPGPRS